MSAANRIVLGLMLRADHAEELEKLWAEKVAAGEGRPQYAGSYTLLLDAAPYDEDEEDEDEEADVFARHHGPACGLAADRFLDAVLADGRWRPGDRVAVNDMAEAMGVRPGTAWGWARLLKREGRWPFPRCGGPTPEVLRARVAGRVDRFLAAVESHRRWRPGDIVRLADAAEVAGVSKTGARDYVNILKRQGRWPYKDAPPWYSKPAEARA